MPLIHMTHNTYRADDEANMLAEQSPGDHFQLSGMLFHGLDWKIDGWISRQHSYALSVNQISGGKRWTTRDSARRAHTDRSDTRLIGAGWPTAAASTAGAVPRFGT